MKNNIQKLFAILALMAGIHQASAQSSLTFTNLHSFDANTHPVNGDYENLPQGLVQGTNGILYGMTYLGGSNGYGEVFQITTAGAFSPLLAFDGSDGAFPTQPLLVGKDGNLYGQTSGASNQGDSGLNDVYGELFRITTGGTLTPLHLFNGSDGDVPAAPLVLSSDGSLYGSTMFFGGSGHGTIFQYTNGAMLTLASIASGGNNSATWLALSTNGVLYGEQLFGGTSSSGSVFVFANGTMSTLSSFTGANGSIPEGLVNGNDGNFYSVTAGGGYNSAGTFCQITTNGVITTLFSFGGTNGVSPNSLMLGKDGNFYGTASGGGASNDGTVFEITPGGALTTLYSFSGGSDGSNPNSLMQASDGNFYGTTTHGNGTVFALLAAGQANQPLLSIAAVGNQSVLFWPASATNYVLQSTTNLTSPNWVTASDAVPVMAFTVTNQSPARFFRLVTNSP